MSLKFYVTAGSRSNHWIAAQLIKGGTTTEFVEAYMYSLDDDDCKGTRPPRQLQLDRNLVHVVVAPGIGATARRTEVMGKMGWRLLVQEGI